MGERLVRDDQTEPAARDALEPFRMTPEGWWEKVTTHLGLPSDGSAFLPRQANLSSCGAEGKRGLVRELSSGRGTEGWNAR